MNCEGSKQNFRIYADDETFQNYKIEDLPEKWKTERYNMSFKMVYSFKSNPLYNNSNNCCVGFTDCNRAVYPTPWFTSIDFTEECVNFKTIDLTCLSLQDHPKWDCHP